MCFRAALHVGSYIAASPSRQLFLSYFFGHFPQVRWKRPASSLRLNPHTMHSPLESSVHHSSIGPINRTHQSATESQVCPLPSMDSSDISTVNGNLVPGLILRTTCYPHVILKKVSWSLVGKANRSCLVHRPPSRSTSRRTAFSLRNIWRSACMYPGSPWNWRLHSQRLAISGESLATMRCRYVIPTPSGTIPHPPGIQNKFRRWPQHLPRACNTFLALVFPGAIDGHPGSTSDFS
jgi:hypothetical protein